MVKIKRNEGKRSFARKRRRWKRFCYWRTKNEVNEEIKGIRGMCWEIEKYIIIGRRISEESENFRRRKIKKRKREREGKYMINRGN